MQTSIERRAPASPRMPVTMSVELAHDGWDETYEADLTNLSGTGIGVRGPVLPDVGQRMRCRFSLDELTASEEGGTCEAEGEVVWASDAGDAGEFGIRFDTLEPQVGEALARWVATLEGESDRAPSVAAMPSSAPKKSDRRQVKVQLDGVASPIEAEVAVSEGNRVRVEQPLPFLLLGTKATVDAGGDRGLRRVLRSVELKIEGSVPKLVLELERAEASIAEDIGQPSVGQPRVDQHGVDDEGPATVSDEPLDELLARASEGALRAAEHEATPSEIAPVEAPRPRSKKRRDADSVQVVLHAERDPLAELGVDPVDGGDEDDEPTPLAVRLAQLKAGVQPTITKLLAAIRAGWATTIATSGPRLSALGAWLAKVLRATRDRIAERAPQILARLRFKKEPKRRTTAAPPEAIDPRKERASKRAEAAPEIAEPAARPKIPLRLVLAAGLGALAIFFVVRAFSAPAEVEAPIATPTLALAPEPEIEAPAEIEAPIAVAPTLAEPEPAAATPAPAPTLPGTLGAASTEAGRLAAPTFPRVEATSEEPSTAEAAPETDEPLPRPTGARTFGATDVPHGRSTTLTMTLPISSIEGEANENGFTVTLPGVNSLSRAAPIAAANPSVERAAILNSGDHAVLTVRFVAGRSPAYRVEARGAELIVTIGR